MKCIVDGGLNLKQLQEEKNIKEILDRIKRLFPDLRIPAAHQINFFDSPKVAGWGGDKYGIDLNLRLLDNTDKLRVTLIHELVHYQGIMNHGRRFKKVFTKIIMEVNHE